MLWELPGDPTGTRAQGNTQTILRQYAGNTQAIPLQANTLPERLEIRNNQVGEINFHIGHKRAGNKLLRMLQRIPEIIAVPFIDKQEVVEHIAVKTQAIDADVIPAFRHFGDS